MSNRAWMPLHIEAYMADTLHLSAAEHGAYMLLIMRYWKDGGLPADERMIQRYSRLSSEQWTESRDVLAAFFDEGWKHKRIDAELAKADEIIEKRRNAANKRHTESKPDASAVHVQSKSTDTGALPRTLDQEQKEEPNGSSKKRGCRLPADFVPDLAWAVAEGMSHSEAQTEASQFHDYWISKPGQAGVMLDWPATWRRWVRNQLKRRPASRASPPRQPNLADGFAAASHFAENRYDPRSDPSDESTRRALSYLPRVSG